MCIIIGIIIVIIIINDDGRRFPKGYTPMSPSDIGHIPCHIPKANVMLDFFCTVHHVMQKLNCKKKTAATGSTERASRSNEEPLASKSCAIKHKASKSFKQCFSCLLASAVSKSTKSTTHPCSHHEHVCTIRASRPAEASGHQSINPTKPTHQCIRKKPLKRNQCWSLALWSAKFTHHTDAPIIARAWRSIPMSHSNV